jgi:G3E family GTPase
MTPLIVFTGFLGSGKTTLMRQLIPLFDARAIRPSIILNDYKNAYVDAASFRGLADEVVPIGGTCVCCGSRYQLMEALSGAALDASSVMMLEANGTADVPELIEMLVADPSASRYTMPVQVVLVDVKRWQKRYFHDALEKGQVPTAGYVVFTRLEEVSEKRREAVMAEVAGLAPRARMVDVQQLADVIADLHAAAPTMRRRRFTAKACVYGAEAEPENRHPCRRHHDHDAHHFSSLELRMPDRVQPEALRTYLEGLPPEVIRAKGIAYLDDAANTPVYFQKVEGRDGVSFHSIDAAIVYDPVAILIGVALSPDAFIDGIAALAMPTRVG